VKTPQEISELAKSLAREVGFDLAGVARAQRSQYEEAYRAWIAAGKHGAMEYMAKNVDERVDITRKFPWAKSVVCVALAYWQAEETQDTKQGTHNGDARGKIARYAWGRDYHKVMEGMLKKLERRLREELGEDGTAAEMRAYSDTGPILEREFAQRAGLGWVGKNTLLVNPRHGSWFVLGELITSVEMAPDSPMPDHCGTCRRCIEACPTDAITPYSVDGSRCISYLTLEERGAVREEFFSAMQEAGFVVGCDICQEVCPFNRAPLAMTAADFAARTPAPTLPLEEILAWQEMEWDQMTRGRAFRRAKWAMWRRNAEIVGGELERSTRDEQAPK
jgi:epoxyqueuosine reductase